MGRSMPAGQVCLSAATALLILCDGEPLEPDGIEVNGHVVAADGGTVVHVYGSHAERGHAHGYLLASGIKEVFEKMYLRQLFDTDDSVYAAARAFVRDSLLIDERYRREAGGVVRGMRDAKTDMRCAALAREMDSLDILVMSVLEELITFVPIALGCTSLSNWGGTTEADTVLRGELVISRHWDYPVFPAMVENLALIVHHPSEPDEQSWVAMHWAGMVGSCSAVNGGGVGAFLNYGVVDTLVSPGPFLPVSFALRAAIELDDYNGDGRDSPLDVADAYRSAPVYFPAIVHAVTRTGVDSHAIVIEVNNHTGVQVRTSRDNGDTLGEYLAAVNHFRVKYPPAPASVYPAIVESLRVSNEMTPERQAALIAGAGGWSGTTYRVQYVPFNGTLRWGCAVIGTAAYLRGWNELRVEELVRGCSGR